MFRDILVWEMVCDSDGHKFVLDSKLKSSKNDLLLGMNLLQNRQIKTCQTFNKMNKNDSFSKSTFSRFVTKTKVKLPTNFILVPLQI